MNGLGMLRNLFWAVVGVTIILAVASRFSFIRGLTGLSAPSLGPLKTIV